MSITKEVRTISSKGKYKSCQRVRVNGRKQRVSHIVLKKTGHKISTEDVVHHIDGDTQNNNLSNLHIMTRSEHTMLHNPRDYSRYGVSAAENKQYWMQHYRREMNPNYGKRLKVTPEMIVEIRQLLAIGFKQKDISEKFNIAQSAVSNIKTRKRYNTDYGVLINKREVIDYGE